MSTGIREELESFGRYLGQTLRLIIGVPDCGTYMRHMQETHPGQTVITYEGFFRERQGTCYTGRVSRCC